jgi:glutathione S-transferase
MAVTIFGSIGSRASRCLWVAEEIGLDFDWKPISTLDGSNRTPEYLAINPSGKIPAMQDDTLVLTESFAINQYLAERYGSGTIWPDDPQARGMVHQWTFWSATEIERYVTELFPHFVMLPEEQRDKDKIAEMVPELLKQLGTIENALEDREYLLGDFSLADINLAIQTFTFVDRFKLPLDALPRVAQWTARCRQRPGRQKVEARVAAS